MAYRFESGHRHQTNETRTEWFGFYLFFRNGLEPEVRVRGGEGSAAGGRCSDPSEWLRSADEEAAPTATKMPGTATGHRHQINETRTEWFGFYLFLSERTRTHLNVAPRWGVTRHRHHWKDRHSPLFLLAGRRYILEFASVLSYDKSRKTRRDSDDQLV